MIRRGLTFVVALVGLALPVAADGHEIGAADLGGGGPDGVPAAVERALGGRVTLLDNGLYKVHSGEGFSFTTHGPDFGPDIQRPFGDVADAITPASERPPVCATDYYQEVLYGYPTTGTNQLASKKASIQAQIRTNNALLNQESIASGGPPADYKVRCDPGNTIRVTAFPVTPDLGGTTASFDQIVIDAKAAGFGDGTTDTNVDYTIFYDGAGDSGACGVGYLYATPGTGDANNVDNPNNNPAGLEAGYGASFDGCWFGRTSMHENGHNQGAVQRGAPNSTGTGGHCNEADDIMCYLDGGSLNQNFPQPCPLNPGVVHFDCGYNTYFDSLPEAGEWLNTHWNIGSTLNRFIQFGGPSPGFTVSCTSVHCAFTDQSIAPAGVASRSWAFGDGGTSTATNPGHDYASFGTYNVTLTVTDGAAVSSSLTKTVVLNDSFANPQPITGSNATLSGSNAGASKEVGEPNHAAYPGGASVWYRWTAPAAGPTTINTCGSSFDTLLGVYTGSAVNGLTTIASNDENPTVCGSAGVHQSALSFHATAGTDYQIAVDGYLAETGPLALTLARADDPPPPPPAGDITAPETTIVSGTTKVRQGKNITFAFASSESGSTFSCEVDRGGPFPCSSPYTVRRPRKGTHVFEVRAIDAATNVDLTPARQAFQVKKKKPRHH